MLASFGLALVVSVILMQVATFSTTIYLHRCQAHRALDLHPVASHFFRFWLWLTTGMVTKEWAAIHRKHHAKCESAEDPHSPQVYGINRVLWLGVFLYVKESYNKETLERYGQLLLTHVKPALGVRPLQQLKAPEIDRLYAALAAAGEIAPRTQHHVHVVFGALLATAARKGLIVINPHAARGTGTEP